MIKVLILFTAPATFFDAVFCVLEKDERISLHVGYCHRNTDGNSIYNTYTHKMEPLGRPMLQNYDYFFMKNLVKNNDIKDWLVINPEIKERIDALQPNVIISDISYWSPTAWFMIKRAKKAGIPIITRATVETARKRPLWLRALKRIWVTRYCRKMMAGVYECPEQRAYLMQYGMKDQQLFYAPCAVDNDYFSELSRRYNKHHERMRLGISDKCTSFVFLGGLTERKRPHDLLQALSNLLTLKYDVRAFFIGDGELMNDCLSYSEKHLQGRAVFPGYLTQEDTARYMVASDVYVIPSLNDASPKALNEAMNYSLPIVVSDGVGTKDKLLKEGKNGYSYHAGDVDALTKVLSQLIKDKMTLPQMGINSKRIIEEFGYDSLIDGWMKAAFYCTTQGTPDNK